jgi:hypothetical protein
MATLQQIATDENFPPTVQGWDPTKPMPASFPPAEFVSLTQVRYNAPPPAQFLPGYYAARGNFINAKNPRYAWVPLYRRGLYLVNGTWTPEPTATVIMILVQSRNRTEYTSLPQPLASDPTKSWTDFMPFDGYPQAWNGKLPPQSSFITSTLEPALTPITLKYDATTGHGVMTFPSYATQVTAKPATGTYVIIASNDNTPTVPGSKKEDAIGRIYQLGAPRDEYNQMWELTPGGDMFRQSPSTLTAGDDNDLPDSTKVLAYIIGRGYADMTQTFDILKPDRGYLGPAQDIGIYTGFIQIRQP